MEFNPCQRLTLEDLRAAFEVGAVVRSMVHNMTVPEKFRKALFTVISEFITSDMRSANAAQSMAEAVINEYGSGLLGRYTSTVVLAGLGRRRPARSKECPMHLADPPGFRPRPKSRARRLSDLVPLLVLFSTIITTGCYVFVFVLWNVYLSLTTSMLLPVYDFAGVYAYLRMWRSPRWTTGGTSCCSEGSISVCRRPWAWSLPC